MKVHELLAEPSAWTQGFYARNRAGAPVSSRDDSAVCWCLDGALLKCHVPLLEGTATPGFIAARSKLLQAVQSITYWNDRPGRTHAEVLELCKRLDV